MRRLVFLGMVGLSWVFLIAAGGPPIPPGPGWPPQTDLYNDALLLARVLPFLAALGIGAGIWEARSTAKREGDAIVGNEVRRHATAVLIIHWMNAFGMILCLVTGAMVLRWSATPVDERLKFTLHYVGAALIVFAVFNHLARQGVTGGIGLLPKRLSVMRDLIGELLDYLGLFGPEGAVLRIPWPRAVREPIARYVKALLGYKPSVHGKYLVTEQLISYPPWAILTGAVVITGVIKLARYIWPLPAELVASATAIHDLATIGIGLMLVIHLLPLLLVPANWPLLLSMFRTTVPLRYVEKRHPLWYQRLMAQHTVEPSRSTAVEGDRTVPAEAEASASD